MSAALVFSQTLKMADCEYKQAKHFAKLHDLLINSSKHKCICFSHSAKSQHNTGIFIDKPN